MAQQPRPPVGSQPAAFRWEGDSTLHSYTYDYMLKRGWNEAATRFAQEAGIDEAAWTGPPIEAPQGLLYEWWSVFWDVFIARSQKSGPRNPNADAYVEAMRAKREPLSVSLAGPNPTPLMNLPRSLAHPPRLAHNPPPSYGQPGGPTRAAYDQMHVLEQQELQYQMQQRGRMQQLQGQAGMRPLAPGGEAGYPTGPGPARQLQLQQQQMQQQQYGQAAPPVAQQQMHLSRQPQAGGPPGDDPSSAHGSPQLAPSAHLYTNGRPGEQQGPPGNFNPAFQAAIAAVGLAGRDPESLSNEEHAAVAAQMRRMGALPPTMQNPAARQASLQHQQMMMMTPQGRVAAQAPMPQRVPSDPQNRMYFSPQQQHQQQQQAQQQQAQQQRMLQYSQGPAATAASPASPAYSSPYSTPQVAHMQIPPSQQQPMHTYHSSPAHEFAQPPLPLSQPPPSRGAAIQQSKKPMPNQQASKGSPAANVPVGKRGAGPQGANEDPSPRTRKRPRPGTQSGEDDPGTPAWEQPTAGSPATYAGQPQQQSGAGPIYGQDQSAGGVPYRPSPSPGMMHPPPPRNYPPPQQQKYLQHQQQHPQQQYLGGNSDGAGGAMASNGFAAGGAPGQPPPHSMVNGNGNLSRPASAMSNHHLSPGGPVQHFSPSTARASLGGPGPDQRTMSPAPPHMRAQMQMQQDGPGPGQGQIGMSGAGSAGDGRSGLAGGSGGPSQPPSTTTTPLPPAPQQLGPPPPPPTGANDPNGVPIDASVAADGSMQFNLSGDDMFSGLDFDTFLNNDMFAEDATA